MKKKDKKKDKKNGGENINRDLFKKLINIEEGKKGEVEREQKPEQEDKEFFLESGEVSTKKRINPSLEESFGIENQFSDVALEETLIGVETKKGNQKEKEFYSRNGPLAKTEEDKQRYARPFHQPTFHIARSEIGPTTVQEIRINLPGTSPLKVDALAEMRGYNFQNQEGEYKTREAEIINPMNLNRRENKNPFLQEIEREQQKYE